MHILFLVLLVFLSQGCVEQPSLSISKQELVAKSYNELGTVAKSIDNQGEAMGNFVAFINIMKNYVNNYSKTIKASAYLSNAIRVLPIPYAGEVSNATKLISHSLVTLNNTAYSLQKYRQSSSLFIEKYNKLEKNKTPELLSELSNYADNTLIIDALALEGNMAQISQTTESLVSATELISTTSSTALGYLDKAKSLVLTPEEISNEEKTAITKSKNNFHTSLVLLNNQMNSLKNSAMTNRQSIAKARVLSDLALELEKK